MVVSTPKNCDTVRSTMGAEVPKASTPSRSSGNLSWSFGNLLCWTMVLPSLLFLRLWFIVQVLAGPMVVPSIAALEAHHAFPHKMTVQVEKTATELTVVAREGSGRKKDMRNCLTCPRHRPMLLLLPSLPKLQYMPTCASLWRTRKTSSEDLHSSLKISLVLRSREIGSMEEEHCEHVRRIPGLLKNSLNITKRTFHH